MTETPGTMPDIIARNEQAVQRALKALGRLSPAQMIAPLLAGGRTVKDVLAHMTWWDQWLLATLPAVPDAPPIELPLADQIPASGQWADEMNGKVFARNQSRELSDILVEFATTLERLLDRVSLLTLDDLYAPDGMSAVVGQPVAPLILGIYEHYEEHAHEFEELCKSLGV